MKKRTSKSASATSKTSSRSGMSDQTDATARKQRLEDWGPGKFDDLAKRIKEMSSEEFRESLVDAGIIDQNGKLTEKYRTPRNRRAKGGGRNAD